MTVNYFDQYLLTPKGCRKTLDVLIKCITKGYLTDSKYFCTNGFKKTLYSAIFIWKSHNVEIVGVPFIVYGCLNLTLTYKEMKV